MCSIKYAEGHLYEKDSSYWKNFLQNVVASDDSDLRAQALYLLLKAYYHDGYIEEAFNIVKAIETNYLTSSVMDDVSN